MNASEILTTIFDNLQTATARRFRDGSEQIPMLEWEINAPSLARAPAWMRAANRAQNALLRAGDAGVFTLHASHGSMYLRIRAPLRECSAGAGALQSRPGPYIHDANTRRLACQLTSGATWHLRERA